jgi:hypothetical protein
MRAALVFNRRRFDGIIDAAKASAMIQGENLQVSPILAS